MTTELKSTSWEVEAYVDTYTLPKLLHEIRVKDWSLPLVGDYKGNIVAYVAGAYWDDPEAAVLAKQHAELIASAPTLKAENERLQKQVDELKAALVDIREQADGAQGAWAAVDASHTPEWTLPLKEISCDVDETLSWLDKN